MRAVALVGVLALVVAVVALAARTRIGPVDLAWIAGSPYLPAQESDVYQRYLARHRRHRVVGGALGALVGAVVGFRLYGEVTVGIGVGSPLGDALFCGVAGVLLGALSAETYRLSEPRSTVVAASLAERPALTDPRVLGWARSVVGLALAVGLAVLVTDGGDAALACAVAGGLVTGVGELTLHAIHGRRRPVLTPRAQEVDLRLRTFAAATVSRLELAAAVLGLGWTITAAPVPAGAEPVSVVLAVGLLVATVVLLRRASPRPRGAARRLPAYT